jgi:hypothetical protein
MYFQSMSSIQKPGKGEYNPYFQGYIDMVPEGDFNAILKENTKAAIAFFESVPAAKWDYRYDTDKWSIKQLLVHITDAERVFSYRALVAARGDNKTKLHPMDDHLYVEQSGVEARSAESLIAEFKAVRSATEALFDNMDAKHSSLKANGVSAQISARALGYIITGHVIHHMKVIKEWYL